MGRFTQKFLSIVLAILLAGAFNLCACVTQCVALASPSVQSTNISKHRACCAAESSEPSPAQDAHPTDKSNCPHCSAMKFDHAAPVRAEAMDVSLHLLAVLPPLPRFLLTTALPVSPRASYVGDSPPALLPRDLVHTGCQLTV